jgi:hypothetical protein
MPVYVYFPFTLTNEVSLMHILRVFELFMLVNEDFQPVTFVGINIYMHAMSPKPSVYTARRVKYFC